MHFMGACFLRGSWVEIPPRLKSVDHSATASRRAVLSTMLRKALRLVADTKAKANDLLRYDAASTTTKTTIVTRMLDLKLPMLEAAPVTLLPSPARLHNSAVRESTSARTCKLLATVWKAVVLSAAYGALSENAYVWSFCKEGWFIAEMALVPKTGAFISITTSDQKPWSHTSASNTPTVTLH